MPILCSIKGPLEVRPQATSETATTMAKAAFRVVRLFSMCQFDFDGNMTISATAAVDSPRQAGPNHRCTSEEGLAREGRWRFYSRGSRTASAKHTKFRMLDKPGQVAPSIHVSEKHWWSQGVDAT